MLPPYQWQLGASAMQPTQGFVFNAPAVRAACDADPVLGYELPTVLGLRRLQATRARVLEVCIGPQLITNMTDGKARLTHLIMNRIVHV